MSGLFCDTCGYERPGCSCDDPFFHKHAMELKAQRKALIAEIRERLKPHLANYEDKQKRNAIILYKTIETILKEIEK